LRSLVKRRGEEGVTERKFQTQRLPPPHTCFHCLCKNLHIQAPSRFFLQSLKFPFAIKSLSNTGRPFGFQPFAFSFLNRIRFHPSYRNVLLDGRRFATLTVDVQKRNPSLPACPNTKAFSHIQRKSTSICSHSTKQANDATEAGGE